MARQRNYGIDLLRIFSMLMIITLHILGFGGGLSAFSKMTIGYEIAWFIEIASYCAVNCYALISGYVGCDSKYKYSNIAYIWLQVAFYAVLISAIAAKLSPEIGIKDILPGFLPVSNKYYWYFTSYFCMFFFIPLLNKVINDFNQKQLKVLGIIIISLFSVVATFAKKDLFLTSEGYSVIWLGLLYLLGGIIKKCNILYSIKSYVAILMYLLSVIITWLEKYIVDCHNLSVADTEKWQCVLINYTSPTILFAAIMLLVGFSKLKTGKVASKIISIFAPFSFAVYIIHEHKYVRNFVIRNRFSHFDNVVSMVLTVVGSAIAIYLICALIDFIREKLFKLLRIRKILIKIEEKFVGGLWENKELYENG